jgi:hypothetical protein
MESLARSFVFGCAIAVVLVLGATWYRSAHAVTKCEPDGKGGLCCWDTAVDGIFRPISCL